MGPEKHAPSDCVKCRVKLFDLLAHELLMREKGKGTRLGTFGEG